MEKTKKQTVNELNIDRAENIDRNFLKTKINKLVTLLTLHTCDEALFYFEFDVIFQFEFIYC